MVAPSATSNGYDAPVSVLICTARVFIAPPTSPGATASAPLLHPADLDLALRSWWRNARQ